jgi:sigma-B regulation protein RsbU (phosphoserine phosphatase)
MSEDLTKRKVSGILSVDAVTAAFQAQSALFKKFISVAKSPDEAEVINTLLRRTIEISTELTGAELGSLILLDDEGVVIDSILSRGEISPELSSELIETVLEKGLAGWVKRQRKIGLINDTEKDERWLILPDQPYTARSALALPIISGKMLLGILTLIHSLPGHFKQEMVELMEITASQVALVLENANLFTNLNRSYKTLAEAKREIENYSLALDQELESCRQIQKSFLPRQLPSLPNWNIEEFFFPANRVSGDFYDVFMLPGGYLSFVIGDVCDKGVGSALFMALFRSLIRIFSGQAQLSRSLINTQTQIVGGACDETSIRQYNQIDALRTVALTNDYIAQEHSEMSMFATLFFGVLDPKDGNLIYINGGHENAFIIDKNGIRESLTQTGQAVGMFPQAKFEYKQIQLKPGDILFAYTDGVIDARSPEDERFTKKRLISILSQSADSALELMERIGTSLFDHIGKAPQEDDITMLTLQRHKNIKA